ncbi:hypothetical protein HK099_000239, partial [Clydaea vesicula]
QTFKQKTDDKAKNPTFNLPRKPVASHHDSLTIPKLNNDSNNTFDNSESKNRLLDFSRPLSFAFTSKEVLDQVLTTKPPPMPTTTLSNYSNALY